MAKTKRLAVLLACLTCVSAGGRAVSEYGPTKPGESLWTIAKKVHGEGSPPVATLVRWLYEQNPHAFAGGKMDRLRLGVMLRIPEPVTEEPVASPATPVASAPDELPAVPAGIEKPAPEAVAEAVQEPMAPPPAKVVTEPVLEMPSAAEATIAKPADAVLVESVVVEPIPREAAPEPTPGAAEAPVEVSTGGPVTATASEEPPADPVPAITPTEVAPAPAVVAEAPPEPEAQAGEAVPVSSAPAVPTEPQRASPPVQGNGMLLLGLILLLSLLLIVAAVLLARLPRRPAQAAGKPEEGEDLDELLVRAERESAAGHYNLARSVMRRAIAQRPDDPELRLKLLAVEHAQGDAESFAADAEDLRALLGGMEGPIWAEAEALGKELCPHLPPFCPPEEAAARRAALYALTPEHSLPELLARAEQETLQGNYNLARSALRQAIALVPQDPQLWMRLLRVEYQQGDAASFAADMQGLLANLGVDDDGIREEAQEMERGLAGEATPA